MMKRVNQRIMSAPDLHIFCIRHNNDLDCLAPIMDQLLHTHNQSVLIFCAVYKKSDLKAFKKDFRIQYLIAQGAHMCDLSTFLPSGLYRYFMRKCHQANKTQAFLQKAYEYIGLFEAFDAYCLKLGQPVTVTRDYYSATDVFTLIYNRFFLRKIKTIMSSHASTQNFSNTCISDSLLERPKDPSQFHTTPPTHRVHTLICNDHFKTSTKPISHCMPLHHTHQLSPPRLAPDWLKTLQRITPLVGIPNTASGTKKILLLLAKPNQNYFTEEIFRIIATIARISNVHLMIQRHPRTSPSIMRQHHRFSKQSKARNFFNRLKHLAKHNDNLTFTTSNNTVGLMNWSDLILCSNTSVIIHAIACHKPVLHLRRVQNNTNAFEAYMHNWHVDSRDELLMKIEHLKQGTLTTYSEQERLNTLNALANIHNQHHSRARYVKTVYLDHAFSLNTPKAAIETSVLQ